MSNILSTDKGSYDFTDREDFYRYLAQNYAWHSDILGYIAKHLHDYPNKLEQENKYLKVKITEMDNWFYENLDCNYIAAKDSKFYPMHDKLKQENAALKEKLARAKEMIRFAMDYVGTGTMEYEELDSSLAELGE